jgi:cation transport ATPase
VGDLLLQHLDALEQQAEEKGGVQQVLADHFARVYCVTMLSIACAAVAVPTLTRAG